MLTLSAYHEMVHKRADHHYEQDHESISFKNCPNHIFDPVKKEEECSIKLD